MIMIAKFLLGISVVTAFVILVCLAFSAASEYMDDSYRWGEGDNEEDEDD